MKTLRAALLCLVAFTTSLQAGIIVGNHDTGNCYPFSCAATDGVEVYQQVYSSSAFSGPLTFDTISFFRDESGPMDTATFTIRFSTTALPVLGLTSDDVANEGADVQEFGTFSVTGGMPEVLSFTGTPFSYDPARGNLLMTVLVPSLPFSSEYLSFFQADSSTDVMSRAYWSLDRFSEEELPRRAPASAKFRGNDSSALVTGFGVAEVPEPSTFALLGLGLAGVALARRRG